MFGRILRCSQCDWAEPIRSLRNLCPSCAAPILVHYEIEPSPRLRDEVRARPATLWRYREILPVEPADELVSLGEGSTPLLRAERLGRELGLRRLYIKDESQNPTRSFKARGMTAAVTMAKKLGARAVAVPTAGNAGCALAAYAARGGLPAFIAMPRDTPPSIVDECRQFGAEVELVDGLITDAARKVQELVSHGEVFDLSTLREPYRVEGKKIMGYELLEDLGRLPDVIIYPTGGGTGLVGMWKAFDEMQRLGWIGPERPRIFAVQPAGCAAIVRAFLEGSDHASEWADPHTMAWGLRVPRAIGDRLMLKALRESHGGAVAVPEGQIEPAADLLRRAEGIDAGPESGAGLAGLRQLVSGKSISADERVVLFNTGGNKYR